MLGLFALHGTLEVLGGPTGFQTLSAHSAVLQGNTCGHGKAFVDNKVESCSYQLGSRAVTVTARQPA